MSVRIHRRFVRIGQRHVHLRHAGQGPALVLLHQSPQNSRMWLDMISRFADRYTVIAPDTPGFGYSDPLDIAEPSIADLAEATVAVLDALGIDRFAVFGMHTGGLVAAQVAAACPERVTALVVDGYAAFTPAESAIYGDRYLPPFVPAWDGSHLRWLWSRMREQKYFFPWYDDRAEAAMAIDPHTTQSTHEAVMDVLEVGDAYRAGYGAAFRHVEHGFLSTLHPPSLLVFRRGDPLLAHLPRLPELPANVKAVVEENGIAGMHARMDALLADKLADEASVELITAGAERSPHCAGGDAGRGPSGGPDGAGWSRGIVACAVGDIAFWSRDGVDSLRLALHAPGERPLGPADLALAGTAVVVAPDLPGHGGSSEIDADLDAGTMVSAILATLGSVPGQLPVTIESHGAAAGYVPALAAALGERLQRVVLHRPWLLEGDETATLLVQLPDPQLLRAGGHLDEAWQWERERHLMWPWLTPSAAARRRVAAPTPAQVNDNVVELLRLGERCKPMFREAASPGLAARLGALGVRLAAGSSASTDDYLGRAAALLGEQSETSPTHP
ncbi:alpha/beta fold hydrolase [Lysobacter ciconiae]|uniref:Alpha/beta fold hydrolase n=1 Tax=Novilysobacter ciconiae TaxID=2781022 RepID=A0A7S6UFU2_9GAMM|nr:alpha/beta fold hydrolase [Lysobacter ciconiae]QOW19507.1 alpha/beta fold hydrolase [Lysobacter ciconiae]